MKKICSVVGARPQFIKLAVVSRVLRKYYREVLIHTGQHYDHNMSDVFFEEMDIPKPDYNLGISGGTHGQMTGQMLIETEKVFLKEQPDMVLLFGDTNSTMAAALAAVKLHIPICHVEAGNRFGTLESPEEVNRTVTDHLSAINLPCTESSLVFLEREGLGEKSTVVGDPMYDAFCYYTERLDGSELTDIQDFSG
ncbi:MAG: UDP-N-acetylglucosamine 2-epimerase (non-hydrolyzing), partial [Ruminococcaceae bacterium]|nr:UDP-N-acetylglucosamine 2-epimerase (non-hydrolyzing) [Oscillospiraceae bacterium]